ASVLLPDPFGPMIAWISPAASSRSTPRRISVPSSAMTACRFSIFRSGSVICCQPVVFDNDSEYQPRNVPRWGAGVKLTFSRVGGGGRRYGGGGESVEMWRKTGVGGDDLTAVR